MLFGAYSYIMEDLSNIKLDLDKIKEVWNPFKNIIWVTLETPITEEEITSAIENNQLIHPDSPKKMYLNFWDESTREEHIQRIAWLVVNYNENFPIEIDFGIPELGAYFAFIDGNHRMAAAIYRKEKYIRVSASGSEKEILTFI